MRYVAFIHRDRNYGVSFPDFPGCVSVGDSISEAVRPGSEALALHVEGMLRSIDDIHTDPSLADWRRGADLAWIPLLLDRGSQHLPRPRPARSHRRGSEAAADDPLGVSGDGGVSRDRSHLNAVPRLVRSRFR